MYPVSRIVTSDAVYLDLRWVAPSDRSEVVASLPPPAGFGGRPLGRDAPSCFICCKTHFKEQLAIVVRLILRSNLLAFMVLELFLILGKGKFTQ